MFHETRTIRYGCAFVGTERKGTLSGGGGTGAGGSRPPGYIRSQPAASHGPCSSHRRLSSGKQCAPGGGKSGPRVAPSWPVFMGRRACSDYPLRKGSRPGRRSPISARHDPAASRTDATRRTLPEHNALPRSCPPPSITRLGSPRPPFLLICPHRPDRTRMHPPGDAPLVTCTHSKLLCFG